MTTSSRSPRDRTTWTPPTGRPQNRKRVSTAVRIMISLTNLRLLGTGAGEVVSQGTHLAAPLPTALDAFHGHDLGAIHRSAT